MKLLLLGILSLCSLLPACTIASRNTFQVIRNCHTPQRMMRPCLVQYRVVPDGRQKYHYYFQTRELESTVFEYSRARGKQE